MLTISDPIISDPTRGAATAIFDYYTHSAQEVGAYYSSDSQGTWIGQGCHALGLSGPVTSEQFCRLFAGFSPRDGAALVQNAGKRRQAALDLTFSCDKSVSVRWALGTLRERKLIKRSLRRAAKAQFAEVESIAGLTRRGHGGWKLEPAKLTAFMVLHETNRAGEPQLHMHFFLFLAGERVSDQSTGSLYTKAIFKNKMLFGERFRTRLGSELSRAGFPIEIQAKGFKVRDVDPVLTAEFSQRRKAILARMKKLGLSGAVAAKVAALDTRTRKAHIPREASFKLWRDTARSLGWHEKSWEQVPKISVTQEIHQVKTLEPLQPGRSFVSPEQARSSKEAHSGLPSSQKSTRRKSARRRIKKRPNQSRPKSKSRSRKRLQALQMDLRVRRVRPFRRFRSSAIARFAIPYIKLVWVRGNEAFTNEQRKTLRTLLISKRRPGLYVDDSRTNPLRFAKSTKRLLDYDAKRLIIIAPDAEKAAALRKATGALSFSRSGLLRNLSLGPFSLSSSRKRPFRKSPFEALSNFKMPLPYWRLGSHGPKLDKDSVLLVTESETLTPSQAVHLSRYAYKANAKVIFLHSPLDERPGHQQLIERRRREEQQERFKQAQSTQQQTQSQSQTR